MVEPLFGLRPIEHHDAEHDLREVEPSAGWLFDRLVETRSCVEAAGSLARAVASLARGSTGHASVAAGALELVRRTGGGMPVDGIAQVTGTSERHLRRTVRREAGISLKAYARIARLLRAMTAADRTPTPHWARISADCDYCDQSHLVRECRALAGCTPGELHRERRAEAETSNPD
ncbi:MAG TPA: helix-turn-helix domain-containing protein [Gemmatimonadales bacterium]|jgi:AraC-like DNA-binding protein|nr:helix-turn-helix domain-containing protein [Gemmatimonadales bacterium]